jgi:hypothetical protein
MCFRTFLSPFIFAIAVEFMFCHRVVISDDDVSVWHVLSLSLSLSLFLSLSLSLSLLVSIGNPTDGGGDGSNRVAGAKVACYTNTNY